MENVKEAGKAKKPIYKRWWGILGISFIALILLGMIVGKNDPKSSQITNQNNDQAIEPTTTSAPVVTEPEPQKSEGKIDLEHFQKLEIGMTKSEIDDILGESGELISSTKIGDIQLENYQYKKAGLFKGKIVTVTLENNKMSSKMQAGL